MAEPKLIPVQQWICDHCNKIIESPEHGYFEWYDSADGDIYEPYEGFRIVHNSKKCLYNSNQMFHSQNKMVKDLSLDRVVGPEGLVRLLSFFERPLMDPSELTEIVRRLHVEYYEESRVYRDRAESDNFFEGMTEYLPYIPEISLRIIRQYGD